MHWRVVIAGLMILVLLAGGVVLLNHLNRIYDSIIEIIDTSIQSVGQTGSDDRQRILEAQKTWEASLPLICTFVIHSQIDSITQRMELAAAHLEEQEWVIYVDILREIRFGLELLKDYDKPSIRSVL